LSSQRKDNRDRKLSDENKVEEAMQEQLKFQMERRNILIELGDLVRDGPNALKIRAMTEKRYLLLPCDFLLKLN
jgi:hypothetical protein